jgi:lipopolysaccharide transport system ATP-binding protein
MSSDVVIKVEHLSKRYSLGVIGTGTLSHDLNRWWAKVRGKPDPTLKIGAAGTGRLENGDDSEFVWALRDVTFEVKRGEVLGIIGANGAGKSTLLKILSRVTAPTMGEVKIKGRIASLLEVGTGFHPELTGRENIFLNGAILGMTKAEVAGKLDEIVDFSGCDRYIDTPVKRYSSGMYVRLAFAVAAHLEPEILIVDEVLAVGDAAFQKKCLGKMSDVAREGRTVLFVSHNMVSIKALCHTAVLLNQGGIQVESDAESVVHRYLQAMTQPSSANFEDRTDRKGNGSVRFSHIGLLDAAGTPVQAWISGQGGRIRLRYKNVSATGSERLHIAIGLNDEMGTRIALLNNEITGDELSVSGGGGGTIDVIVPRVRCMPGTYSLTLYSKVNGSEADWVTNAFSLYVQHGDFFGTGKPIPAGESQFLMEHSFTPAGSQCSD